MSAVIQRLGLFWTSNSAQARADFGKVEGGVLGIGRAMGTTGKQTGLVNSQMRALGTTMKYALSGSVVFGTMSAIRNLSQFQQQLGLISAEGTQVGIKLTGDNLEAMSNQILKASVTLIEPISDVTNGVINLTSHVRGVQRNELVPMLTEIGKAAKLSQTPVEDMTVALTTMQRSFGMPINQKTVKDLAAKWVQFVYAGPATAGIGPKIIGNLGGLSQVAQIARINPGQMFSMMLANLQFGINAQQTMTGLRFAFQQLATGPQTGTAQQRQAFASMGVTTQGVQSRGGFNVLLDVFKKLDQMGGVSKSDMKKVTSSNFDPTNVAGLGLSSPALVMLTEMFKSRFALRNVIALYQAWKRGTLFKDLKLLGDSHQSEQDQVKKYAAEWKNFTAQSGLAKAATELQAMQMQIAKDVSPVLQGITAPIGLLSSAMLNHPDVTKVVSRVTAGLFATMGINKLFGGHLLGHLPGPLGKFGRWAGGASGQAAIMAKTAEDFAKNAAGGSLQDGSPERPFYVIIVGQDIPSPGAGGGGSNDPLTNPTKALKDWRNIPGLYGGYKLAQKFGGTILEHLKGAKVAGATVADILLSKGGGKFAFLGRLGRVAGPVGVALTAFDFLNDAGGAAGELNQGLPRGLSHMRNKFPLLSRYAQAYLAPNSHVGAGLLYMLQQHGGMKLAPAFEKALESMNRPLMRKLENQNLTGDIWLNVEFQDSKGKTAHAKVHLPPDTFTGGKTPGSRGRKKVLKVKPNIQSHL